MAHLKRGAVRPTAAAHRRAARVAISNKARLVPERVNPREEAQPRLVLRTDEQEALASLHLNEEVEVLIRVGVRALRGRAQPEELRPFRRVAGRAEQQR